MFPKADIHPVVFDEIYIKESGLPDQPAENSQRNKNEEKDKKLMNSLEVHKRHLE